MNSLHGTDVGVVAGECPRSLATAKVLEHDRRITRAPHLYTNMYWLRPSKILGAVNGKNGISADIPHDINIPSVVTTWIPILMSQRVHCGRSRRQIRRGSGGC